MAKKNRKVAIGVGAGVLTAAALAAAGAYLLSSKQQKAKAKAWALKAKKEVARNVKTARRMGEGEYKHIVDRATKRYGSLHNVNAAELVKVARELKAEWTRMQQSAKRIVKKAAPAKKATKAKKKRTRR